MSEPLHKLAATRVNRNRAADNTEPNSTRLHPRPAAYAVHSTFGDARTRGSRLNRPCDACRRRKTACIITSRPPCNFCKTRKLACTSRETTRTQDRAATALRHEIAGRDGLASASSSAWSPPHPTSATVSKLRSEGEASSASDIHSLEDNNGMSTYFIGQASEQDPMLLAEFRYDILDEYQSVDANVVSVYDGTEASDDRPVNFLHLKLERTDAANQAIQAAAEAIGALVQADGDDLVRLYFRHVHPVFPIIPKRRFLELYASDRERLPVCLLGAVYGLASVFSGRSDPATFDTRPFAQHEVLDQAHAALRREIENPTTLSLAACVLLIHATPPFIDTIEEPTTWTLSAQATATAQILGLHQDPAEWSIPLDERRTRRKLWWAVYMTECWSAVSHGTQPHIAPRSFNTLEPDMLDLQDGEDIPEELHFLVDDANVSFDPAVGERFLQMVKVARSLRLILDSSFQVYPKGSVLPERAVTDSILSSIKSELNDWTTLPPSCLSLQSSRQHANQSSHNCSLHLTTYTTKVMLYRALMHPATKAAKRDPYSPLRTWFPEALAEFAGFTMFLSQISTQDLNGFWGRHARSQLTTCANFLIYLFLMASERTQIESAYGLLESFVDSAKALKATGTPEANIFLRPAALRIESFFIQAADIMRRAS